MYNLGVITIQERFDLNKTQDASAPEEVECMKRVPYTSTIGSLNYTTAVKNILKYLRATRDMFLVYGGNLESELRVKSYCDAGFQTNRDDTKSQTGFNFVLNGDVVDWRCCKQSTTSMTFIYGLGVVPTNIEPMDMYCDNSGTIIIANEPGVQRGARHNPRRYHYVRECIELGEINLLKVHTDDNLADQFTKALPKGKLTQHAVGIGLRLVNSFM
ncbi:hypothetical protein Tco_0907731 [Tanacetum coccineum]|uniref:Uncharacterized protein n=1 Tax=Tanacetum coccineum TaxID=301880 RepID=A0ABQ5CK39_9ASTR